jgi:hypothetical protein
VCLSAQVHHVELGSEIYERSGCVQTDYLRAVEYITNTGYKTYLPHDSLEVSTTEHRALALRKNMQDIRS